jgi:hypothetical protein
MAMVSWLRSPAAPTPSQHGQDFNRAAARSNVWGPRTARLSAAEASRLQAAERLQPRKAAPPRAGRRVLWSIYLANRRAARLMACHEQRQDNLGGAGLSDFQPRAKSRLSDDSYMCES